MHKIWHKICSREVGTRNGRANFNFDTENMHTVYCIEKQKEREFLELHNGMKQ